MDEKAEALHIEDGAVDSKSSGSQGLVIDPEAEKRLLRKCDLRVVPALWLLFLLAFLDRTNIGNAKIQGLTEDLNMTGNDYNIALFVFFIPYILFEGKVSWRCRGDSVDPG